MNGFKRKQVNPFDGIGTFPTSYRYRLKLPSPGFADLTHKHPSGIVRRIVYDKQPFRQRILDDLVACDSILGKQINPDYVEKGKHAFRVPKSSRPTTYDALNDLQEDGGNFPDSQLFRKMGKLLRGLCEITDQSIRPHVSMHSVFAVIDFAHEGENAVFFVPGIETTLTTHALSSETDYLRRMRDDFEARFIGNDDNFRAGFNGE